MFRDFFAAAGPAGVAASVAGATYGVAAWLEDGLSNEARQLLSASLQGMDTGKIKRITGVAAEVLNRIFGPDHFSFRCLFRSALFSIVTSTLLLAVQLLLIFFLGRQVIFEASYFTIAAIWILLSIVPDYLNLYKTRLIIRLMQRVEAFHPGMLRLSVLPLIIIDFVFGFFLFYILFEIAIALDYDKAPFWTAGFWQDYLLNIRTFSYDDVADYTGFKTMESALFYASMVPSLWLWLYGLALEVMPLLLGITATRKFLDIEKHPGRSIGRVAAVIVFVGAVTYNFFQLASTSTGPTP